MIFRNLRKQPARKQQQTAKTDFYGLNLKEKKPTQKKINCLFFIYIVFFLIYSYFFLTFHRFPCTKFNFFSKQTFVYSPKHSQNLYYPFKLCGAPGNSFWSSCMQQKRKTEDVQIPLPFSKVGDSKYVLSQRNSSQAFGVFSPHFLTAAHC